MIISPGRKFIFVHIPKTPGRVWKHSTLADMDGVVDPADFFVVTLVRNPWDRMVSYYHWLQAQHFDHPAIGLANSLDFSAFLNHPLTAVSMRTQPYARYVTDAQGQEHCQLFARLEHLDADLQPLWDHLGFTCDVGRENASQRGRDWRGYYSDQDAAHLGMP